jgi:hypothetical protein
MTVVPRPIFCCRAVSASATRMKTRQNRLGRAVARRTEADMRDDLLRYWGARRAPGKFAMSWARPNLYA